jgi:ATP-dependent DNA ligase
MDQFFSIFGPVGDEAPLERIIAGFIAPCLPTKTDKLPSGSQWLHEIKHDGFRIIARKTGAQVRLYSRPGNDFTRRFPLIVDALSRLRSRSCIIDGEAVACGDNGVASFDLIRHHRANETIFLYAFDLIELNGDDLRRDPLEVRKATLASIVAKASPGIRFNEHIEGPPLERGRRVFALSARLEMPACKSRGRSRNRNCESNWGCEDDSEDIAPQARRVLAFVSAVKRGEGGLGKDMLIPPI